MPDRDDTDATRWDDPDEFRDVDARRWRPTRVLERVLGIDEYRSVVARAIGMETGPVSDLMIDLVALGTVVAFVAFTLVVRLLVG